MGGQVGGFDDAVAADGFSSSFGFVEMIKKEESAPKYGIADVSMAGRKLWLVKVPQRMAELFDGAAPGTEIAQLTVTPGEKGNVVRQTLRYRPENLLRDPCFAFSPHFLWSILLSGLLTVLTVDYHVYFHLQIPNIDLLWHL